METELNYIHSIISSIYETCKANTDGNVADYIPELANVDSELFGISFCDINGNQTNVGNTDFDFCLQSCSKPLTYCLAEHKIIMFIITWGMNQVEDHLMSLF